MSKRFFSIFYVTFLIGALLYGSLFIVGPISVRHVVTIMMFFVCLYNHHKLYSDSFFKIYLIFIFFFFLSSFMSGYTSEAIRRIIGYYFVSYVGLFSTYIMVTKYNGEKIFLFTICGIGILDAVVTMGQILFIPSINNLVSYLQLDLALKEEFGLIQGRADFGLGFGIPGVFGVVANSYYLMVASILSMSAQTKKLSLIGLLITSFLLVACFVVQERSSFYLATTFVIILAFVLLTKLFGKFTRLFILFIFLLLLSLLIDKGADYINSFETRMSDMFSLTGRDAIWANAIDYISQYPIFAGYDRMMSIYHRDAHNLILNAYIFGGLFGFIAIIVLTVRQFILIAKSCLLRCKINNLTVMVLSCTFIAYTVNSLVHNFSVVYGTLDIWLVWACLYSIVKRERQPYSSNGSYLTQ